MKKFSVSMSSVVWEDFEIEAADYYEAVEIASVRAGEYAQSEEYSVEDIQEIEED